MTKVYKVTLQSGETFIDYTELSRVDEIYFYNTVNPFNPVRTLTLLLELN